MAAVAAVKTDVSVDEAQLALEDAALQIYTAKALNLLGSRPAQAQTIARHSFALATAFMVAHVARAERENWWWSRRRARSWRTAAFRIFLKATPIIV